MERDEQSYAVIGHAMAVHREIGPGIDEWFYHRALADRLEAAGIEHQFKPRRSLEHRGGVADVFEPDLVLPGKLVTELKVLPGAFHPEHFLQLKAYQKFWRIRRGLLFDFGKESLIVQSHVYDDPPVSRMDPGSWIAGFPPDASSEVVCQLCGCLARVAADHGFGYRDTTYRGLLIADFMAEGFRCVSAPTSPVRVANRLLGHAVLSRIVGVDGLAVFALSQRKAIRAADRAVLQTALRLLGLQWGLIAHFGTRELELQCVRSPRVEPDTGA